MSTAMIWQTVSTSSADTEHLGEHLGKLIKSPEVIELRSDLGGGKTTFVKGLAAGAGSQDVVTSPTFTLNKIYRTKAGDEIHHYDFYRLNEPGIMRDELRESLNNPRAITVIEWAKIVEDVLPKARFSIELRHVEINPDERLVIIKYPETQIETMKRLESDWQQGRL